MSKIYKKCLDRPYKTITNHKKYLSRITKTLYYGKLSKSDSLSLPVTELASELFSEAKTGKSLERLHCDEAAKISRNACVSPCSLVLALLYLERLKTCNPEYLDRTAPSDLFLISLMVSCKFLFDDGESDEVFTDEWAASGGMTVKELVRLEKDFLCAIDWKIYVSELTFWKKLNEIEQSLALKQGSSRGHFTYTELQSLAASIEINKIVHCVVAVSLILAATYTAGLLTIFGSVYLASQVQGSSLYSKELENCQSFDKHLITEGLGSKPYIIETKPSSEFTYVQNSDVIDVFTTSILLASIKVNVTDDDGMTTNDAQFISWDYWNIPIMEWLAKSSEIVITYSDGIPSSYFSYYLETSAFNSKCIELEDQVHKATKTRLQDQIESSWHEEWIDTLKFSLFFDRTAPYVHGMKV
nr:protein CNPPD1 [Leptinotarsa decemlineata]